MTEKEFLEFGALWEEVQSMYNRNVSDTGMKIVFSALADFSLDEVKKALAVCMRESKFAPTVADIVEVMRKVRGEDKDSLTAKANAWYTELNHEFDSGKDVVTDDLRAVKAFKTCFGSLVDFGMHDPKSDPFDRKAFVECYVATRNFRNESCCIKGAFHNSDSPRIKLIGDKNKCKKLADEFYGKCNKTPRLPSVNALEISNKKPPLITAQFSPDCDLEVKQIVEKFLEDFKRWG